MERGGGRGRGGRGGGKGKVSNGVTGMTVRHCGVRCLDTHWTLSGRAVM